MKVTLAAHNRLFLVRFQEEPPKRTIGADMDKKTMEKIDAILARGDRVELIPVKDGVKVVRITRKEVK